MARRIREASGAAVPVVRARAGRAGGDLAGRVGDDALVRDRRADAGGAGMMRIQAVIFDWAGTTVDHGSLAPVRAVTEVFRGRGVAVSDAEARRDMGIYKRDHIRNLLFDAAVSARWLARFGAAPEEADVES